MIGRVCHTGYLTDDVEKCVEYFEAMLGGEVIKRTTSRDGTRYAFIQIGDSEVEVIEPVDKSRLGGRTGLIVDHVGYFVDDIDAAIAELASRGVKFATPETTVGAMGDRMIFLASESTMGTRMHITRARAAK